MKKNFHFKRSIQKILIAIVFMPALLIFDVHAQTSEIDCKQSTLTTSETLICDYSILRFQYGRLLTTQQSLSAKSLIHESQIRAWNVQREACNNVQCMDAFFDQWETSLTSISSKDSGANQTTFSTKNSSSDDSTRQIKDELQINGGTLTALPSNQEVKSATTSRVEQTTALPSADIIANPSSEHEAPADGSVKKWQIYALIWLVIVIIGTILGFTEKIVVFRNYNDLALVFFIGFSIVAAVGVLFVLSGNGIRDFSNILVIIALTVAVGLLLMIAVRTWQDNPSVIRFPFAFITKITLAGLFLINLIDLISPSGKTQAQRAKAKRSSLLTMTLLAPIIYKLVREKEGVWGPKHVFNQYQRGKIKL